MKRNAIIKWIGSFLYIVAFVLLLDVIKRIITGRNGAGSFYIATIIICIQFFVVAGYILLFCFYQLFSRFRVRRQWLWSFTCMAALFTFTELVFNSLLNHPKYIPSWLKWSFQFYYDAYDVAMIQFRKNTAVYDPALFYTLKPGSTFDFNNREFKTVFHINSKGIRDDERSLQAPDIICLGDSYGMGWGVQQQETYAQRLESATGMKVLNAGVSSYGTAREMKQLSGLDTSALKYVIIQYCGNDLGENLSFITHHQSISISSRAYYDSVLNDHKLVTAYFPGKHTLLITQLFIKHQVNSIYQVFNLPLGREDPLGNLHEHAAAFVKVLSAGPINFKKVKVIVTLLENDLRKDERFLTEVETLIQQEPYKTQFAGNVSVLDAGSILDRSDYFYLDPHITSKAHQKLAEKLKQVIQQPAN